MRAITGIVGILIGFTAATAEAPLPATQPFILDHNRMIVEVECLRPDGSARPAMAWVDTGTQVLVLAEPLARDLGFDLKPLKADRSGDSVDIGASAPVIRLASTELDSSGVELRVRPGAWVMPGVPAEVHLPASLLRRRLVVFDYPNQRLSVGRPGAWPPRGTAIPCRVNSETGLPMIDISIDGETLSLGLDNGSSGTWVSNKLTAAWAARHPEWPRTVGALGSANFFGLEFEVQGTLMRLPELGIGTLVARGITVLGLDQGLFDWYSRKSAGPVAGFIGANVLGNFRLEIDFANQMTYWEAGPPFAAGDLDMVGLTLRPEPGDGFIVAGVISRCGRAAVVGVQPGDRLIRIDGRDVSDLTMGTMVGALRGRPGATHILLIERQGRRFRVKAKVVRFP